MFHNRQPGGPEECLHDVLVHARRRAQHTCANVWNIGQLEQALDRSVLAKGSMQNWEDDVHVNGAIRGTARRRCIAVEGHHGRSAASVYGLGRDDHRLAARQHGRAGSSFRVAGSQMPVFVWWLTLQHSLSRACRQPAAFFGNADGHYFKFILVDGVENRCGR